MKQPQTSLTASDALILQQISLYGEDDIDGLASELGEPRQRILSRLHALRTKGLVVLKNNYKEIWVELSSQGKQLVRYIWPETTRAWV